ncbi:hypothetical protein ACFQWC_00865 [Rossellomorea sp. GCM10028870]|uniref:hypothetical protein n=1 Tax=Rossellomorea sp. GCM10028870 TaxID=3273426 RepID=UPI0036066CDB
MKERKLHAMRFPLFFMCVNLGVDIGHFDVIFLQLLQNGWIMEVFGWIIERNGWIMRETAGLSRETAGFPKETAGFPRETS